MIAITLYLMMFLAVQHPRAGALHGDGGRLRCHNVLSDLIWVSTMGKINIHKLLVGGLVAGVVLSAIDVAMYGAVLKAPMADAWKAVGRPTMTDSQRDILLDFVVGVALVWVYAAILSRFGAGLGTALKAGIACWFLASVLSAAFSVQGVMPLGVMIITALVLLVEYPIAVVIGAKFYSDRGA